MTNYFTNRAGVPAGKFLRSYWNATGLAIQPSGAPVETEAKRLGILEGIELGRKEGIKEESEKAREEKKVLVK